MSLLIVGSIALDSIQTPVESRDDLLGGSAVFFSHAAALLYPVQVVGVVGDDFPEGALDGLVAKGVDLSGVEHKQGESFRWKGRYSHDFKERETIETRLGVFAEFDPRIPDQFSDTEFVFLGNIDPVLQLRVLDQVRQPKLVACDTMNYWIQGKRDELMQLLGRIDVLMVNDSEVLDLSGQWNVYRAARWILEHGPRVVVIKQGGYGAVLVEQSGTFYVPAFPLADVADPTGAGDAFAGGFMAQVARTADVGHENLRNAMVYGAAMGSFAVERFSVGRFEEIGSADVTKRVRQFRDLVRFEIEQHLESAQ